MLKIRNGLQAAIRGIDQVERWIVTVLFGEVIIVGFLQVICRFVLKASLPWSEELLRFSFIWLTYIAASMGIMRGTHSDVRVVVERLPLPVQKGLNIFREIITLAFCVVVFRFSLSIISLQIAHNQFSPAMRIPMYIPYSGVMVSFGLMVFQCLFRLFNAVEETFCKKSAKEAEE